MPAANDFEDSIRFIRECLVEGRVRWTYHVTMRLRERSLRAQLLLEAVASLEIIEAYPRDKYLPSFLVRGEQAEVVFHVQIATDVVGRNVRIVTMYRPRLEEWDAAFRVRRLMP